MDRFDDLSPDDSREVIRFMLGVELTEIMSSMMNNPKSDITPERWVRESRENGAEAAKLMREKGRSFMTAYYDPETGLSAYLQIPEPGSPIESMNSRWNIIFEEVIGNMGSQVVSKTTLIEIEEDSFEIYMLEDTVIIKDAEIDFGAWLADYSSQEDTSTSSSVGPREMKEYFSEQNYSRGLHQSVVNKLRSLKPEHELLDYDPQAEGGIQY